MRKYLPGRQTIQTSECVFISSFFLCTVFSRVRGFFSFFANHLFRPRHFHPNIRIRKKREMKKKWKMKKQRVAHVAFYFIFGTRRLLTNWRAHITRAHNVRHDKGREAKCEKQQKKIIRDGTVLRFRKQKNSNLFTSSAHTVRVPTDTFSSSSPCQR